MYISRTHNIQLVYLPPHSFHILQPLDLSIFSALKRRYRATVLELSTLDDAAPVKKSRFIQAYCKARKETFSSRVIRAGWTATGLSPWNPQKALQSSLVLRPVTPPKQLPSQQSSQQQPITTPQKPQDVHWALQSIGTLTRKKRFLFSKVSKRVSQLTIKVAALERENQLLKRRQEGQETSRPRKRAAIDPSSQFWGIFEIQAALAKEAENEREGHAETVSREAQRQGFESMCFQ